MRAYVKAIVATVVSLSTFAVNIPIIVLPFKSTRFKDDLTTKVITSLAVSDFGTGLMVGISAVVMWITPPGGQVSSSLCAFQSCALYAFGICSLWHLALVSTVKCCVIVRPLTYFTIFTDKVILSVISVIWIASGLFGLTIGLTSGEWEFNWDNAFSREVTTNKMRFMDVFSVLSVVVAANYTVCGRCQFNHSVGLHQNVPGHQTSNPVCGDPTSRLWNSPGSARCVWFERQIGQEPVCDVCHLLGDLLAGHCTHSNFRQ
jgi:hypothetical protein